MNNKENRTRLVRRMEIFYSLIPDTIEAVESLPLEFGELFTITAPGTLRIDMLYDLVEYKRLRRLLRQDWRLTSNSKRFNEILGSWFIGFEHKRLLVNLKIGLVLSSVDEGGVCYRIKIGETTQPVYKMECK